MILSKFLRNFGNYRQNLINFDENLPEIGILSPEITIFNPGIDSRRKETGLPGLTSLFRSEMTFSLF
jgi:hypothetical protein